MRWKALMERAVANSSKVRRAAYNKAFGVFSEAKRGMLREFDRHLVTQEIEGGPTADNMSGTLGGYGNLFSFIGFYQGDKPTEPLRWLLEQTSLRQTVYRNGKWYFRVSIPSKEDVELATPMPWEIGNSWAYAVETMISGLSHYMYKWSERSRSGTGIQLPWENLEDAAFKGTPYITEILQTFRERINTEG
jgi:hypothetical protein